MNSPVVIGNATLYLGDALDVLPTLDACSVDAIVTDPPYGLGFMGKDWDHGIPGVHFWQEALRVAKPGAHLLAFGGTRTFHRLAVAIEDAGWEIRDTVMWVYGSGFPKSLDVGKAIDKAAGAEREIVGPSAIHSRGAATSFPKRPGERTAEESGRITPQTAERAMLTAPATDAAKQWDGWGTALKPAWEPIIVARKPLEGTVAGNVLKWGVGAINVDGCRVATEDKPFSYPNGPGGCKSGEFHYQGRATTPAEGSPLGRWPANLIHDGSEEVVAGFPQSGGSKPIARPDGFRRFNGRDYAGGNEYTTPAYESPGYGDSGSAARFFWCAKASKKDRDEGCEAMPLRDSYMVENGSKTAAAANGVRYDRTTQQRNHHPTVKPTALMRYLCRLVTPPGGTVLDPFMGSGSTGKAAEQEGFGFIGIDLEPAYFDIACKRIENAQRQERLFA